MMRIGHPNRIVAALIVTIGVIAHPLAARNSRGPGRMHELVGGRRFEIGGKLGPAKARTRPEVDLLTAAGQPASLTELYQKTGWPKSTIHGLLSTMRESAVVDQQSDERYCLGVRLFEYGCAVGASWSVSDLAKLHLQHLASVTGPSVFLSMLNRSEVITIEQVQSRAGLRVVSEVGTRLPLHCTSQGKVFLSAMADHEAKRVLSRLSLIHI